MGAAAISERDVAVLRSFAQRIDPSDAGAHNNLGVLYHQKGLIAEAIEEFTRALELDPKMQVAQDNLETAYSASGYYDTRVAELQGRLRHQPDDRDARWQLGRAYASLGHHAEAVAEFEALVSRHPKDAPAIIQLGLAQKAGGHMDEASEWFEQARQLEPDSSVARFYCGEALYNRGLNDQALVELQAAIKLNPDYADAHYLVAFVYGDMGQHDEAKAATKRAVQLNPTLARAQTNLTLGAAEGHEDKEEPARPQIAEGKAFAHFNLGLAFRQKGYYAESLREYRLALDSGEDRRLVLEAMAEVHLLKRDFETALDLYDGLVREFEESPKLWNERGVCLHQAGRREAAQASYEKSVAIDPGYALAWNNLGVLLADNQSQEAITAFNKAIQSNRQMVDPRLNLALQLFHLKRFQPALEMFKSVLSDAADNAIAWNGVGLVLMELKRFADAKNAFARSVEGNQNHAPAHYNLSFTLSQLGDFDGALRETKRALELEPYYVPQKFSLRIDLQYEDPTIAIVPEISGDVATTELGEGFTLDEGVLDDIFAQLVPDGADESEAVPDDEAPFVLARDYIGKGLLELATAELNRAVSRGGSRVRANVLLGDIFAKRGYHGEALERYRGSRAHDPDDTDALRGEVTTLLNLDRAHEAADMIDELARRSRSDVDGLVACAQARLALGEPVPALDHLKQAQALEPGRPDLSQLQAKVAILLGDLGGALEAYQAALQLDPGLVQVWYELGGLEERRRNWAGARLAYERALNLLPTYVEATLALARLLITQDSPRAAIHLLVDLLSVDPYEFDALLLLAQVLLADGRLEQAREALVRILKFETDNLAALYFLGDVQLQLRDYEGAKESWLRVVTLDPANEYAHRARSQLRSAKDLKHIFAAQPE